MYFDQAGARIHSDSWCVSFYSFVCSNMISSVCNHSCVLFFDVAGVAKTLIILTHFRPTILIQLSGITEICLCLLQQGTELL